MKVFAILIFISSFVCPSSFAGEVHGASDTYTGEGVAIAWGVLRGANEESTLVVVRVVADAKRYSGIEVAGIDPFTRDTKIRLPARALAGSIDLRLPRSGFADHPRTELRFSGAAPLVVYYLGIPDTTPEFASAAALEAHLASRLAKLRATGKAQ